ncbi:hypothetical protein TSUD_58290 [Trifolium subterraneum]|uniref:Uncharacterized protein n=1 Tax=Trifolium subterraneum TaxID=3900 RepID=A0A2Z6MID9_TRISU|nr:hypothetical protein TSUD_58290 [Trifolium subterraneum]
MEPSSISSCTSELKASTTLLESRQTTTCSKAISCTHSMVTNMPRASPISTDMTYQDTFALFFHLQTYLTHPIIIYQSLDCCDAPRMRHQHCTWCNFEEDMPSQSVLHILLCLSVQSLVLTVARFVSLICSPELMHFYISTSCIMSLQNYVFPPSGAS